LAIPAFSAKKCLTRFFVRCIRTPKGFFPQQFLIKTCGSYWTLIRNELPFLQQRGAIRWKRVQKPGLRNGEARLYFFAGRKNFLLPLAKGGWEGL
jgi:hypothetical protein